ncbi:MAG: hypothetical protein ACOYKE_03270 [Ferruginibacter sp.]
MTLPIHNVMQLNKNSTINDKSICVIGIGIVLKSDDGIGHYICDQLKKRLSNDISIQKINKLDQIDTLFYSNCKLLIIAESVKENNQKDVWIYPVNETTLPFCEQSNHFSPEQIKTIAAHLYTAQIPVFVCAVKGYNFEIGTHLSEAAIANAERAINLIAEMIKKKQL